MKISNDHIAIDVRPERGGSLDCVRFAGRRVFRHIATPKSDKWNPINTACFPLVPFSNRIEHGRFTFDGHKATLSPNMGDHPHAIHGQGWLAEWDWTLKSDTSCEMLFTYQDGEWPWSYSARQRLSIQGYGFRHDVSVTNTSKRTMPAGLGLHPQFVLTPDCSIWADTKTVWLTTPDGIPTQQVPVPEDWALSNRRCTSELKVDHCFTGWNGSARLEWPELGTALTITADDLFDHLVVFVPEGENFFCVEPVSHMPNALNQPDPAIAGMVTLQPGQELQAGVTFQFEDL